MIERGILYCVMSLMISFATITASAQQEPEATPVVAEDLSSFARASFVADNYAPLVGEPVELMFVVAIEPDVEIIDWPQFPTEWTRRLMVRHVGEIEAEVRPDGGMVYRQRLIIYVWRPGDFELPETFVGYRLVTTDEGFYIPARSVFFSVPSVLETQDLNQTTIRGYRPPVWYFYIPTWLVATVTAGSGVGFWLIRRWIAHRRRLRAARDTAKTSRTPGQIALAELVALNANGVHRRQACAGAADIVRTYIQRRFGVVAHDLTTAELISVLSEVGKVDEGHRSDLATMLEQIDLIKFAGVNPRRRTVAELVNSAYQWIEAVDATTAEKLDETETGP
jgi:hypothetical protein